MSVYVAEISRFEIGSHVTDASGNIHRVTDHRTNDAMQTEVCVKRLNYTGRPNIETWIREDALANVRRFEDWVALDWHMGDWLYFARTPEGRIEISDWGGGRARVKLPGTDAEYVPTEYARHHAEATYNARRAGGLQ